MKYISTKWIIILAVILAIILVLRISESMGGVSNYFLISGNSSV